MIGRRLTAIRGGLDDHPYAAQTVRKQPTPRHPSLPGAINKRRQQATPDGVLLALSAVIAHTRRTNGPVDACEYLELWFGAT
jgi:hypothetical protein